MPERPPQIAEHPAKLGIGQMTLPRHLERVFGAIDFNRPTHAMQGDPDQATRWADNPLGVTQRRCQTALATAIELVAGSAGSAPARR